MATKKISVTRALGELKVLKLRIAKAIEEANRFVTLAVDGKLVNSNQSIEEYTKSVKEKFESINSLMANRDAIKSAIVLSNASTKITVSGVVMTVASAIERKASIKMDEALITMLRKSVMSNQAALERDNKTVQERLDRLLAEQFGKDRKSSADDYEAVATPFLKRNKVYMVDPLGIEGVIAKLVKKHEDFLTEVDYVLSESNSRTEIEVPANV